MSSEFKEMHVAKMMRDTRRQVWISRIFNIILAVALVATVKYLFS